MEAGVIEEREQDESLATYAPKVDRATARIDWDRAPIAVANFIRGMDAVPGAWSELEGNPVKLFRPEADRDAIPGAQPGTIMEADRDRGLLVTTAEGAVRNTRGPTTGEATDGGGRVDSGARRDRRPTLRVIPKLHIVTDDEILARPDFETRAREVCEALETRELADGGFVGWLGGASFAGAPNDGAEAHPVGADSV